MIWDKQRIFIGEGQERLVMGDEWQFTDSRGVTVTERQAGRSLWVSPTLLGQLALANDTGITSVSSKDLDHRYKVKDVLYWGVDRVREEEFLPSFRHVLGLESEKGGLKTTLEGEFELSLEASFVLGVDFAQPSPPRFMFHVFSSYVRDMVIGVSGLKIYIKDESSGRVSTYLTGYAANDVSFRARIESPQKLRNLFFAIPGVNLELELSENVWDLIQYSIDTYTG